MRTAFALLAVATLAKNDVSGHCRLAEVCAGMWRTLAHDLSESHSQRFAPTVSASRDALAMSGLGPHLSRDVMPASDLVGRKTVASS